MRTGRDPAPVTVMGETNLTQGNQINLLTIKSEQYSENEK